MEDFKKFFIIFLAFIIFVFYFPGITCAQIKNTSSKPGFTAHDPQSSKSREINMPKKKSSKWFWLTLGVVALAGGIAAAAGGSDDGGGGGGDDGSGTGSIGGTW